MDLIVPPLELAYLALWAPALLLALVMVALDDDHFGLITRGYLRFLLEPWKLATLAIATTLIAGAAPYSNDPTWDLPDSLLVSLAVFLTAPWAMATLIRSWRRPGEGARLFSALVLLLVPCWTYEIYILFRDGVYPPTWQSNLIISGMICVFAGLFWNLGFRPDESSRFTFRWEAWPPSTRSPFLKLLPMATLLASPVVLMVAAFVYLFFFG